MKSGEWWSASSQFENCLTRKRACFLMIMETLWNSNLMILGNESERGYHQWQALRSS
jgi:hypothetical protein